MYDPVVKSSSDSVHMVFRHCAACEICMFPRHAHYRLYISQLNVYPKALDNMQVKPNEKVLHKNAMAYITTGSNIIENHSLIQSIPFVKIVLFSSERTGNSTMHSTWP